MKGNIIESKQKFEEYKKLHFTEEGYKALNGYLNTLTEFYYNKPERDYPFETGFILDIPNFKWSNRIINKDELQGRIKVLMQILGIWKMELKVGDSTITHFFEEKGR